MTIEDLGNIGEMVAAIATVATLVYLAAQIRQNADSLRADGELRLSQQMAEWHARVSAQPDLARIWDEAAADPSALSPEDTRRFRWLVAELFFSSRGTCTPTVAATSVAPLGW